MVTRDQVVEILKTIEDPELFLDIWFLGLIYNIDIVETDTKNYEVSIEMTFTSPMCPAGPMLVDQIKTKVGAIAGVAEVNVRITFSPPWQPSDDVKGLLGMM